MKYDSTHGQMKHDLKVVEKDVFSVNGHNVKCIMASREGPHRGGRPEGHHLCPRQG